MFANFKARAAIPRFENAEGLLAAALEWFSFHTQDINFGRLN